MSERRLELPDEPRGSVVILSAVIIAEMVVLIFLIGFLFRACE